VNRLKVVLGVIVAILILIIIVGYFSNTEDQKGNTVEDQSDEIAWQLLQKTYLEQECREQYMGQSDELEKCFDRIDEEQRLNPPTTP
jgi:predicted Holliday junction resolvase-like endonuclease